MNESFKRLSPRIREYIFTNFGWDSLRPSQEAAIEVILGSEDNLLLSCGTSSGKTEAAFLPILTKIEKEKRAGTSVLYIAPLKALLNDQFERISVLCEYLGLTVSRRHGDVSQSNKEDYLENPSDILQITPESLESLLINRYEKIPEIFGNLKYIVIDEISAMLGEDRGMQVICLVARIIKSCNIKAQISALSATVGDTRAVCELLTMCNGRNTACPEIPEQIKRVSLLFEHFDTVRERNEFLFSAIKNKNAIVFSQSRDETEKITASLREISNKNHTDTDIYIHHGNISAQMRKEAEEALRDNSKNTVVCATNTLELGIDIGKIDRVVSVGATSSVSSFLQRLGRSGRRDNISEMLSVFCRDENKVSEKELPDFSLVQAIAILELYKREKFVERVEHTRLPYSLLCHQTLAILAGTPEGLSLPRLAQSVLTLPPFKNITVEDYKILLSHLSKERYIEKLSDGKVIIGVNAEKLISGFTFYSVFCEDYKFTVKDENGRNIGEISSKIDVGEKFSLAGKTWLCTNTDKNAGVIYAVASQGKAQTAAGYGQFGLDRRVAYYARLVLEEKKIYPYLGKRARKELINIRERIRNEDVLGYPLKQIGEELWALYTFCGSAAQNTIYRYIKSITGSLITSRHVIESPFLITFRMTENELPEFLELLRKNMRVMKTNPDILFEDREVLRLEKYDYLVPEVLLKKGYLYDRTDVEGAEKVLCRLFK